MFHWWRRWEWFTQSPIHIEKKSIQSNPAIPRIAEIQLYLARPRLYHQAYQATCLSFSLCMCSFNISAISCGFSIRGNWGNSCQIRWESFLGSILPKRKTWGKVSSEKKGTKIGKKKYGESLPFFWIEKKRTKKKSNAISRCLRL